MEAVRQTEKKYCTRALTTAIFIGFACVLAALKPIGKGLILGTLFSILNFLLIGAALPLRITASAKKAAAISFVSIALRLILMAVPLFLAIKHQDFNIYAVICGIFMVQATILADQAAAWFFFNRKG